MGTKNLDSVETEMDQNTKSLQGTVILRGVSYRVPIKKKSALWAMLPSLALDSEEEKMFKIEQIVDDKKFILKDIHFQAKPGQLVAILGSSGSGKTTLLDVISMRQNIEGGSVEGEIRLNGAPLSRNVVKQSIGYVMQDDFTFPKLTVCETFTYVARLRCASQASFVGEISAGADFAGDRTAALWRHVEKRVSRVISELGLCHVADHLVGNSIERGVSGGERRRVSVGIQLLMDPSMLLLDEPTSGLDSFTAQNVVQFLSELAHHSNRTIIMSIHQPRSEVFTLIDSVMLLSHGSVAYFGPAKQMLPYFEQLGYGCPAYTNPLDFYIDLISINRKSEALFVKSRVRVDAIVSAFQTSFLHDETIRACAALAPAAPLACLARPSPSPRDPALLGSLLEWWKIVLVLISRFWRHGSRDANQIISRTIQALNFGLILLLFLGRIGKDQTSIQDRTGFLYETIGGLMFCGLLSEVTVFPPQRDMFYRERRDGLYGPVTFLVAYTLYDAPFALVASLLYPLLMFWAVGLITSAANFFILYFVCFCAYHVGESVGILTLSLFNIVSRGSDVGSLILSAILVASTGFLRSYGSMPDIIQWIAYLMPPKYLSEYLVVSQYETLELTCVSNATEFCPFPTGMAYLDVVFPGAIHRKLLNVLVSLLFVVVLRILPGFILYFRIRSIR
eukprot:Sdes_comp19286_c0_seq1m10326